jgi:Rne/Rng family ribonuclease
MAKELYVSSTPHETKVAIVEDDQLSEIYYERENEYTLAGSIYKGRVTRVLPGMQSAFVNIGLERDAFLYVSDFLMEEDEDADAIGEAVARSGGPTIIEARSPEAHQEPIEAERVLPSYEAEEEAGQEDAEQTTEEAQAGSGSQQEPEREGTRRWRGRRRRGRGGRERFGERGAGDRGTSERGSGERGERPAEAAAEEHGEERQEGREEQRTEERPERFEGRPERHEGRPERHEGRPERHEGRPERHEGRPEHGGRSEQGRSEFSRSESSRSEQRQEHSRGDYQRPEPVLLPGESISKYQPHGSQPAASAQGSHPAKAEPATPRPRPSTEYSVDLSQFSAGSMVLPGESLAKYGKQSQRSRTVMETEEPAIVESENRERGLPQDREAAAPVPRRAETREETQEENRAEAGQDAEARVEAPKVFHRVEPAPAPAEVEEAEEPTLSAKNVERMGHPAERMEPPAERMEPQKTSGDREAVSGRHASRMERFQEEADKNITAETAEAGGNITEPLDEGSPARETKGWAASGPGVMEEEEIEEEEIEIPAFEEEMDMAEFEEMEEEVLGQAGDQMLPMGTELMEAVRDAHVNERATGQYEAEGLEPEGEDESEGEEFEEDEDDDFGPLSGIKSAQERIRAEGGMVEEAEGLGEIEEPEEASAEQRAPAAAGYQRSDRRPQDRRGGRRGPGGRRMRGRPRHQSARHMPAISDLLKEGQEILVQIAKEPIAKKGARITSHIALPGRYLVYMPTVHHTGVSRKIGSEEERHRLKRIALSERGDAQGGFIVRTAAAGAEEQDLRNDIRFLINLWNEIRGRAETSKAPALIYHDLNLVERILRDQVSGSFSAIWADTEQEYERVLRFVSRFQPSLVKRVKLYTKDTPLFEQFNITEEINKALKSKVWLRSGGYIVINQTEALVAIDINTGKYVGKTARLEDTIVKTNIDAIKEIVRQIRLRDLGGIIVIDFIDMDERRNRQKVMQALEEALKADRAPSKVLQFNDFGLVAITRKRVKQSLERTLGQPCITCQATGMIKSVTTVCNEIYVEMRKMARHFERDVMVRVHPDVAKALKANNGRWLQEMEELVKHTVIVKSDALVHPEQFDIQ